MSWSETRNDTNITTLDEKLNRDKVVIRSKNSMKCIEKKEKKNQKMLLYTIINYL